MRKMFLGTWRIYSRAGKWFAVRCSAMLAWKETVDMLCRIKITNINVVMKSLFCLCVQLYFLIYSFVLQIGYDAKFSTIARYFCRASAPPGFVPSLSLHNTSFKTSWTMKTFQQKIFNQQNLVVVLDFVVVTSLKFANAFNQLRHVDMTRRKLFITCTHLKNLYNIF